MKIEKVADCIIIIVMVLTWIIIMIEGFELEKIAGFISFANFTILIMIFARNIIFTEVREEEEEK